MNGQPYISPLIDGWWPAVAMDDTLQTERLATFLDARLGRRGDLVGREYREQPLSPAELHQLDPFIVIDLVRLPVRRFDAG